MDKKITMTLAEAANFQAAFDAVEAGAATEAQLIEVQAVVVAIAHYIRDIGGKRDEQALARRNMLATLDEGRRAKVLAALDEKDAPRIWWDNIVKTVFTPETKAAFDEEERLRLEEEERKRLEAAAAAAAATAVPERQPEPEAAVAAEAAVAETPSATTKTSRKK